MTRQPARYLRNHGAHSAPPESLWKRIAGRWTGPSPALILLGVGVALVLIAKLAMLAMLAPVPG